MIKDNNKNTFYKKSGFNPLDLIIVFEKMIYVKLFPFFKLNAVIIKQFISLQKL